MGAAEGGGGVTRLLPESVKESADRMFERIASRFIAGGYQWPAEDQKATYERCISAAVVCEAVWQARKKVHDDDMGAAESHPRPAAVAAGRRS